MTQDIQSLLSTAVVWSKSQDPTFPYVATVEQQAWTIRLNDYPEEPMYTLLIGEEAIASFDDWPTAWTRPV